MLINYCSPSKKCDGQIEGIESVSWDPADFPMNTKLPLTLVLAGLIVVAAVVFWPRDDNDGWIPADGNSEVAAEMESALITDPAGRQAADQERNEIAAKQATTSLMKHDSSTDAELAIIIDGQPVGYPLAFAWEAQGEFKKTLLSDSFGRLHIPGGKKVSGKLELPAGLNWARLEENMTAGKRHTEGNLLWNSERLLSTLDLKRISGWHGRLLAPGGKMQDVGVVNAKLGIQQKLQNKPAETNLRTSWNDRGGSSSSSSRADQRTDAAGNFFAPAVENDNGGKFVSVMVDLKEAPIEGHANHTWQDEELPADGWLGALEMEIGVPVQVRVFGPDGEPLPTADVYAQSATLKSGDQNGVFTFESLLPRKTSITAREGSFLPSVITIEPPFAQTPYSMQLQQTTRIEINLDLGTLDDGWLPRLALSTKGELGFLDSDGQDLGTFRVVKGDLNSTMSSSGGDGEITSWRGEIKASNKQVVLSGVRPEIPIHAEIIGSLGPLATLEIPPRETSNYVVTIVADKVGKKISGLIVGQDGNPLASASVSLFDGEGHSTRKRTGLDGTFEVEQVTLPLFTIEVSAKGYLSKRLKDLTPPGDGNLGTIPLLPSRKLRVRFMHPDGTSGPKGMMVRWKNDEDNGSKHTIDKGYLVVESVSPHLPIELTWTYAGVDSYHMINVGEDKVRIPLPAIGNLKVELSDDLEAVLGEDCYLSLQAPNNPQPTLENPNGFCIGIRKPIVLSAVATGPYRACIYRQEQAEQGVSLIAISNSAEVDVLGETVAVVRLLKLKRP